MEFLSNRNRGFTLIELLVVIAIIGILSSVVLASLNSARQKSRDARRISDVKQLQLALEMYYDSNNGYPTTAQGVAVLSTDGYLPVVPSDPQDGDPYEYAADGTSNYVLQSTLEANHSALGSDVDGVAGALFTGSPDCGANPEVAGAYYYCVMP